jgi:hypothetical protein
MLPRIARQAAFVHVLSRQKIRGALLRQSGGLLRTGASALNPQFAVAGQ